MIYSERNEVEKVARPEVNCFIYQFKQCATFFRLKKQFWRKSKVVVPLGMIKFNDKINKNLLFNNNVNIKININNNNNLINLLF